MTREPRDMKEMAQALVRHVRLLRDYSDKCFNEGNTSYAGEIAGKLRLLVVEFRSNTPLLITIMRKLGSDVRITLSGPPVLKKPGEFGPGDQVTLEQFLSLDAYGTTLADGSFVRLTKTQLIRSWAEQIGSDHEDWSISPALKSATEARFYINDLQATLVELKITTDTVIGVSDYVIGHLKNHGLLDT
jgi:hypothetical protein